MKSLLLLLPVIALKSCSSGHDLMSNKSFRMRCEASSENNNDGFALVANPGLDKETFKFDRLAAETIQVMDATPAVLRFVIDVMPCREVIQVNRLTEEARWISSESDTGKILNDEVLDDCAFNKL